MRLRGARPADEKRVIGAFAPLYEIFEARFQWRARDVRPRNSFGGNGPDGFWSAGKKWRAPREVARGGARFRIKIQKLALERDALTPERVAGVLRRIAARKFVAVSYNALMTRHGLPAASTRGGAGGTQLSAGR